MQRRSGFSGLWLWIPLLFGLACGGGTCSTCEGCGVQPIPGGFPIDDRIANSAQIRLTSSGIQFVEDNIDTIVTLFLPDGLDFPIPRTSTSVDVPVIGSVDVDVCPGSDCNVHGEINNFELTPVAPNKLSAHLRVVLDTRDAGGGRRALPIRLRGGCTFLGCAINTTCQADIDTRRGSRPYVGLTIDLALQEETRAARAGYTRIVVESADLTPGEDIEDDDLDFGSCSGLSGALINLLAGLLKGMIVDQLTGQISDLLQSAIDDQLCTTRGEYGCPTGTFAVPDEDPGSVCRFGPTGGDECVPLLLGTDGQGDLGASFLGGFSPGVHAPGQFLLAAGGDGESVNEGVSVFMYGGFRSTDRTFMTSPAHNPCVPVIEPPPLPTIPRAEAFRNNMIPGTGTESHVGIGLSEQYLNYTAYGAFDSGMLCIGTGTSLSQQLSTGLFSLLVRSLRNLTFPETNVPLGLTIRPQQPPNIEIGAGTETDPLLLVTLPDVAIDFYVWSTERYVRFMTFQADLTIPINLTVADGAIAPALGEIGAEDATVTNSQLLEEDPTALASVIRDVIEMFAGMLTGAISPFALPELMGFELTVPEGGVLGFEDSGDEFLGIFADLAIAGSPYVAEVDTRLSTSDLTFDPASLSLESWGQGETPYVHLWLDADGGPAAVDHEYSVRIDGKPWSPWSRDRHVVLQDRALLFQARHVIEARARVAGEPATIDATPATAEVLVDITPPDVTLTSEADGATGIDATDIISPVESMQYRYRVGTTGEWSEWRELDAHTVLPLVVDGSELGVEVMDEAGNVGTAQAALIRGRPDPSAGGCGCRVPGSGPGLPVTGVLVLLVGVGLIVRRRNG